MCGVTRSKRRVFLLVARGEEERGEEEEGESGCMCEGEVGGEIRMKRDRKEPREVQTHPYTHTHRKGQHTRNYRKANSKGLFLLNL
jgi:hypothetical protein